ncbi:MAG: Fe2+-dependent dioxygenase [Gammaproteobacteria bacterium]|nr:Fe2+-dependent dioxygenase [Gammaproteobacteria bacterium]
MLNEIINVLSEDELSFIHDALATATWENGQLSAGSQASQAKRNEELSQAGEPWSSINKLVVSKLYANSEFQSLALPLKVSAAFVSRCQPGMHYGQHIDNPIMGSANARYRSDIAVTVFLSEPDEYTGGELNIESRFGPVSVKLKAGNAVVYPASSLHEVTPVTSGERLVCVMWVQSMVRDAEQRHLLHDLGEAHQALAQSTPNAQVTKRVGHVYANLLRMWADS